MKKFFKTKFKKIISIFTAIVILTLVLIIPVSATGQNLYSVNYLDNISLVNLSYDELFESSQIFGHPSIDNMWYSEELSSDKFHFKNGRMVLDFSSSYNGIVEVGTYHCSFPFFFKPTNSSNITGSLNTVNYIISFSDSLSYSGTCTFTNVDDLGGSLYSLIEFDLNISQVSNNLFNNFKLQFDFYNASSDASSAIYWYGFLNPPMIIYNSNFSDASSALDNNSKIEEEITKQPFHNSLSNIFTLFQFSITDFITFRDSFLAIRQVFDEFFGNFYNLTVAYLCLALSIIVVISRYMRNRRD